MVAASIWSSSEDAIRLVSQSHGVSLVRITDYLSPLGSRVYVGYVQAGELGAPLPRTLTASSHSFFRVLDQFYLSDAGDPNAAAALFDAIADSYETIVNREQNLRLNEVLLNSCLEALGPDRPFTVLDFGCGPGFSVQALRNLGADARNVHLVPRPNRGDPSTCHGSAVVILTLWMKSSSKRPRFPGLRLSALDRRTLAQQTRDGRAVSARTWKRIRILELLHEQWALGDVAEAVGTYRREVRRVGWRYLDCGVRAALSDDPRPKPPKTAGYASGGGDCGAGLWAAARRLCTVDRPRDHRGNQAPGDRRRRGPRNRASSAGPPRAKAVAEKKMWCVPTLDAEYIEHMEDVLNVLARPYDAREPVVTFDERPVALRGASRPGRPMAAGHIAREDYEYVRTGTAKHLLHRGAQRRAARDARDAGPQSPSLCRRLAADRAALSNGEDHPSHHGQLESARARVPVQHAGTCAGRCAVGAVYAALYAQARELVEPRPKSKPVSGPASVMAGIVSTRSRPSVIARAPGPRAPTERGEKSSGGSPPRRRGESSATRKAEHYVAVEALVGTDASPAMMLRAEMNDLRTMPLERSAERKHPL